MKLRTFSPKIQFLGHNWNFVKDKKVHRKLGSNPERFSQIYEARDQYNEESDSDDYIDFQPELRQRISIEKSLKKSGSFRGAWYLPVEFWSIAESTKVEQKYDVDKAINLYYHLHDKAAPKNPLREKTPPKDDHDVKYEDYQKTLAKLPSVHKFIKFVTKKKPKARVPVCLQTLPKIPGTSRRDSRKPKVVIQMGNSKVCRQISRCCTCFKKESTDIQTITKVITPEPQRSTRISAEKQPIISIQNQSFDQSTQNNNTSQTYKKSTIVVGRQLNPLRCQSISRWTQQQQYSISVRSEESIRLEQSISNSSSFYFEDANLCPQQEDSDAQVSVINETIRSDIMEVVENEYQLQFPEDANSEFTKVMKNINFKEILQECNAPPGAILSSRDYV